MFCSFFFSFLGLSFGFLAFLSPRKSSKKEKSSLFLAIFAEVSSFFPKSAKFELFGSCGVFDEGGLASKLKNSSNLTVFLVYSEASI